MFPVRQGPVLKFAKETVDELHLLKQGTASTALLFGGKKDACFFFFK